MSTYLPYIPALGWLILGLAITLTAYALFADRAKGRRRCPKCWYDMAGLPGPQCPECGHTARSDRALTRTRRRWKRLLFTAPLAVLGYAGIVGPGVLSDGARAIVPNALVALWPLDPRLLVEPDLVPEPAGRVNRFMQKELKRRIDEHRFAEWQFGIITGRIRREYSRQGRYGVSEEERAILEKLASTPFVPDIMPATLADLIQALDAARIAYLCGIPTDDAEHNTFDAHGGPLSLLDGLNRAAINENVSWTIHLGAVHLGYPASLKELSKVAVFDIRDIAPTSTYVERVNGRTSVDVEDFDARSLVSAMNEATDWPGPFRDFGLFPSRLRLGDQVVARVHPQEALGLETLLAALRASDRAGPLTCVRTSGGSGARLATERIDLRVFNLTGSLPRPGPKPDDLSPTDLAWHLRRLAWVDLQDELLGGLSELTMFQWPFIVNGSLVVFDEYQQLKAQEILIDRRIDLSTFKVIDLDPLTPPHAPTR